MKRSMLKRGKPLRARAKILKVTGRQKATRYRALRKLVWDRDGHLCVLCGRYVALESFECHHRKLRSRGGKDAHSNLITLCTNCHHYRVHKYPVWAEAVGLMAPSHANPQAWPIFTRYGTWCVPDDANLGAWTAVAPDPRQSPAEHPEDIQVRAAASRALRNVLDRPC